METETLRRLVLSYQEKEISLYDLLLNIQNDNGLSEKEVFILLKHFDIPLKEIENCVKENNDLDIKEANKNVIHLCTGNVCEFKRTEAIMNYIDELEGFDVHKVPCCGMCSSAPIAFVNGEAYIDINTNFGFKMAVKQKK